jgi:hypothetical protein
MARHQRMPSEEAGYTYAVEPAAIDRLLANEGESIYSRSNTRGQRLESTYSVEKLQIFPGGKITCDITNSKV